jgi:ABC-type sugar transport system substrate-binding protein
MRTSLRLAALLSVTAAAACYTVPISTNVATNPGMRVTSEASKLNVLWITPLPPETSAELLADLMEQCGNRGVTGVTIGTQVGFAVIGQQEKIVATGYCVE